MLNVTEPGAIVIAINGSCITKKKSEHQSHGLAGHMLNSSVCKCICVRMRQMINVLWTCSSHFILLQSKKRKIRENCCFEICVNQRLKERVYVKFETRKTFIRNSQVYMYVRCTQIYNLWVIPVGLNTKIILESLSLSKIDKL